MQQAQRILENVVNITDNPDSLQFRCNLGLSIREMIAIDEIAFVCPQTSLDNKQTFAIAHVDAPLSRNQRPSLRERINAGDGLLSPENLREMKQQGHCIQKREESVVVLLPVIYKEQLVEIIVISAASMSDEGLFLLKGYARLYRNFLGLIMEGQTDSLTGLLNRKALETRLDVVVKEARRGPPLQVADEKRSESDPLTGYLAVIDIDHFKRINDTKGHLFGDEAIILVARLMQEVFRSRDLIFRFGGEEFVVVLFTQDYEGALAALERFRERVASHRFPQIDSITVSIGFVEITNKASTSLLIGQADEALYHAKEHGRNQVCNYETLIRAGKLNTIKSHQDVEFF